MCEQWRLHCTSQWGVVDTIEWVCVLCGHCVQNDWACKAMNLHQLLHYTWTVLCRNYSDDSEGHSYGQLVIGSFITTVCLLIYHILCRVFWQNMKSPRWLSLLQPTFGALWLLAFPKTEISFEMEEISDCQRFRKIWWGSWWRLGELCEVPRCLLWRGLRCHCPMYNVSCILYLLQ